MSLVGEVSNEEREGVEEEEEKIREENNIFGRIIKRKHFHLM